MNSGGLQTEHPHVIINLTVFWTHTLKGEGWGWDKTGNRTLKQ